MASSCQWNLVNRCYWIWTLAEIYKGWFKTTCKRRAYAFADVGVIIEPYNSTIQCSWDMISCHNDGVESTLGCIWENCYVRTMPTYSALKKQHNANTCVLTLVLETRELLHASVYWNGRRQIWSVMHYSDVAWASWCLKSPKQTFEQTICFLNVCLC